MQSLFTDEGTPVNWATNLISIFACTAFFFAYAKTPRKPVPLKMTLFLVICNTLVSIVRLIAPYFVRNPFSCKFTLSITVLLLNFSLFWGSWMSILSARSISKGLQALTSNFLKISLWISSIVAVLLITAPIWLTFQLDIVYSANPESCSLILIGQSKGDQTIAKITFFLYGLFSGVTLVLVTLTCAVLSIIKHIKDKKAIFPINFQATMSRLMWYPAAQLFVCGPILVDSVLWAYFDIKENTLIVIKQIMASLGGLVICLVYALQRLLIYNEEKRMEGSDALSISQSEKIEDRGEENHYQMFFQDRSDTDY